jgi:hypothetical protein
MSNSVPSNPSSPNPKLAEHAREIRALGRRAAAALIEVGRRLIECKRLCKAEGRWLQWIREEFGWSVTTADNFINVTTARPAPDESSFLSGARRGFSDGARSVDATAGDRAGNGIAIEGPHAWPQTDTDLSETVEGKPREKSELFALGLLTDLDTATLGACKAPVLDAVSAEQYLRASHIALPRSMPTLRSSEGGPVGPRVPCGPGSPATPGSPRDLGVRLVPAHLAIPGLQMVQRLDHFWVPVALAGPRAPASPIAAGQRSQAGLAVSRGPS